MIVRTVTCPFRKCSRVRFLVFSGYSASFSFCRSFMSWLTSAGAASGAWYRWRPADRGGSRGLSFNSFVAEAGHSCCVLFKPTNNRTKTVDMRNASKDAKPGIDDFEYALQARAVSDTCSCKNGRSCVCSFSTPSCPGCVCRTDSSNPSAYVCSLIVQLGNRADTEVAFDCPFTQSLDAPLKCFPARVSEC